jgi:hypothetical protein
MGLSLGMQFLEFSITEPPDFLSILYPNPQTVRTNKGSQSPMDCQLLAYLTRRGLLMVGVNGNGVD